MTRGKIPSGHFPSEFSLGIRHLDPRSSRFSGAVNTSGIYVSAHFANEGTSYDVIPRTLLSPEGFKAIMEAIGPAARLPRSLALPELADDLSDTIESAARGALEAAEAQRVKLDERILALRAQVGCREP